MIDDLTRMRDGVAHRTAQRLRQAGLERSLNQAGLKALKTRLYSEAKDREACDAIESQMEAEIASIAQQPRRKTLEERVAALEQERQT